MDKNKLKKILVALSTPEENDRLLELDIQRGLEEKSKRQFGLVGKNFNELVSVVEKHDIAINKQNSQHKQTKIVLDVVDDTLDTLEKGAKETVKLIETKGDVFGPKKSENLNLVEFDGITGKKIKDSGIATKHIKLALTRLDTLEKNGNRSRYNWSTGSDGHKIQEEGTLLTQRANLNFVGPSVTITDDSTNNASIVTITGGGSIGGTITGATEGSVLFAGTAGVLAQDNSNFFWDDTNNRLGIGTASPIRLLHVNATAGAITSLSRTAGATTGTLGQIEFGNINVDTQIVAIIASQDGATDSGNLAFWTEATGGSITERMTIKSSGSVGIGTTTPATELEVASTSASDPRGIMSAQYSTDTVGARLHMRKARGTAGTPLVVAAGDTLGRIRASGYDGSDYLQVASIDFISEGSVAATKMGSRIAFWTNTAATPGVLTEAMRISSTQFVSIGGIDAGNYRFNVIGNAYLLGSDNTSQYLRTDATTKNMFIAVPHRDNADEPVFLIGAQNSNGGNTIYIGNGLTGTANAATLINFATAANSTTTTGTIRWAINSAGHFVAGLDNTYDVGTSGAIRPRTLYLGTSLDVNSSLVIDSAGGISEYENVATAGWGVPAIYANGRSAAQTAAVGSVATYTVGAADGSFLITSNVLVTTSSAENFTVTCAYTDEGNTARTLTLNFQLLGGVMGTAINFANGAVPYEGVPIRIRAKAATAITIATTGTFTGATYNVESGIMQVS